MMTQNPIENIDCQLNVAHFKAETISLKLGPFCTILVGFKREFLLFRTIITRPYGNLFYLKRSNSCIHNLLSTYIQIIISH